MGAHGPPARFCRASFFWGDLADGLLRPPSLPPLPHSFPFLISRQATPHGGALRPCLPNHWCSAKGVHTARDFAGRWLPAPAGFRRLDGPEGGCRDLLRSATPRGGDGDLYGSIGGGGGGGGGFPAAAAAWGEAVAARGEEGEEDIDDYE